MDCFDQKKKKQKKKEEKKSSFFLEAFRKPQFGWLLVFLSCGGRSFIPQDQEFQNLLCVRLIAIIIEMVFCCNWIWLKQVEAAVSLVKREPAWHWETKKKVLPFLACCVPLGEGRGGTKDRVPPTRKTRGSSRAGLSCRSHLWSPSVEPQPEQPRAVIHCLLNHCSSNRWSLQEWFHKCNEMTQKVKPPCLEGGPIPPWAGWTWADHVISQSFSLHLPQQKPVRIKYSSETASSLAST